MDVSHVVIGAGFVLNVLVLIISVTWKLSRVEAVLYASIVKERKELDAQLESMRRNFGEVAAALREKIQQFELWSRDNFVRDGQELDKIRDKIESDLKELAAEIRDRLNRNEDRKAR